MKGITARVKYSKNGLIRFIGHLDTARTLLHAVRRAGIEGVYSEGFTPRLRLSFGPPLPLGCTSDSEYVDIKLARRCEPEAIKERLQSQLPQGLVVTEVEVLEGSLPPLQNAFRAAEYEIEFPPDWAVDFEKVQRSGHVVQASDSRRGEDRVLRAEVDSGRNVVSVVLRQDASGGGKLKEILSNLLGIERKQLEKLKIHKKRLYRQGEAIESR